MRNGDPNQASIEHAYLRGRLSLRLDDLSTAEAAAVELEAIAARLAAMQGAGHVTGSGFPAAHVAPDLALGLRSELARATGDDALALATIEKIHPERSWRDFHPDSLVRSAAFERYLLAGLLDGAGRSEEALGWNRSLGSLSPHEIVYLAPRNLSMAEIHERLGKRGEAMRHYERFLDIWRESDPECQSLVDKVQARLERLRAETA